MYKKYGSKNASLEQKLHELTLQYDAISAVLQQKENFFINPYTDLDSQFFFGER